MNIYLTSYGIDTRHKEYMSCYQEIIEILKKKKVVIIPNARLITQNRATAINVQNELTINNINAQIIDIDTDNINLNNYDAIYFYGRLYHKQGKKEEAQEYYKKVIDNYPESPRASEAKARLAELGVSSY